MSTPADYFTDMYAGSADPWSLGGRWYEQRKYALTLAVLTRPRYRSAFEPGCSVGVLTEGLAARCDALLSADRVPAAVATTRERVRGSAHVTVEQRELPEQWPAGRFDLVVLSEMAYYLDEPACRRLLDLAVDALEPGGDLVAVHWRPAVAEHALTGAAVHAMLDVLPGIARLARHVEDDFLLEVFTRVPPEPRSVAAREGLV